MKGREARGRKGTGTGSRRRGEAGADAAGYSSFGMGRISGSSEPGTKSARVLPVADGYCSRPVETFDLPCLPSRRRDSHKGDHGHVLVVAGSRGMVGAACLAAMGALRGGAGLVTVAVPEPIWDVVAGRVPDALTAGLPAGRGGAISLKAAETILELCAGRDVLAIGPGLSADPEARKAAARAAMDAPLPAVIDADAINALAGRCADLGARPPSAAVRAGGEAILPPRIVTPHPGEMGRLLSLSTEEVQRDRAGSAAAAARFGRCVAVLKGYKSIVSDGAKFFVNRTGGPGMARGGAGDVLAGLLGALVAQGLDAFDAACLGVHLHGLAGEMAAAELTEEGMTASDIAAFLPKAWMRYRETVGRVLVRPAGDPD